MSNSSVTVIVPLYKGEKYIECLFTMIETALKYAKIYENSEIIFVNDFPEDNIRIDYEHCLMINNKVNLGIHGSRIKGLKAAKGKYIHFLDQDDVIKPEFYLSQLALIEEKDVCVSNALLEHENSSNPEYRNVFELQMVKWPITYGLIGCRIVSPGQCLIKRESIPVSWTQHILKHSGSDDLMLWLAMYAEKRQFTANQIVLYKHTYTGENLSLKEDNMLISLDEMSLILYKIYPQYLPIRVLRNRVLYMKGKGNLALKIIYGTLDSIRNKVIYLYSMKKSCRKI